MTSAFLLAYFLHQFAVGAPPPPTYRELRRAEQPGAVTVSVASVVGGSVPPGAQRVRMIDLTFTASCKGDAQVRNITVQRKGMGDYRDIKVVYMMEGMRRITRAQQLIRRDGFVTLRMGAYNVPACETKKLSLYADFDPNASPAGEHRFELNRSEDIKVQSGVARLRQRSARTRAEETQTVVPQAQGKISVTYLKLLRRPTYGSRRTVMRFVLEADGVDDHHIHAITFTNEGSARDLDLQNLFLPGSQVVPRMDGDTVRITFDPPLLLKKNQERLMTFRASIRASRRRTIKFLIEEASDIEATVVRGR